MTRLNLNAFLINRTLASGGLDNDSAWIASGTALPEQRAGWQRVTKEAVLSDRPSSIAV